MTVLYDIINRITAVLHLPTYFPTTLSPDDLLWIHDTTVYSQNGQWNAEFLASYFYNNSSEKLADFISKILKLTGLSPDDHKAHHIIEHRAEAFLNQIIVGRKVDIQIDGAGILSMPPAGRSGISALTTHVPCGDVKDGDMIKCTAVIPHDWHQDQISLTEMQAFVAGEEGWTVLSDIDDTIKVSQVLSIPLLLRNTFIVEDPQPTPNMSEFYAKIKSSLNPCYVYLSASPYNLYPFLRNFVNTHYPPGQIILRDSSWMDAMAVVQSVSVGAEEYKTDEGTKVLGSWLTKRKFICIGDSTQSDPEAYSNLYRKYPDRVRAIWIRVVSGVDPKKEADLNKKERFEKAFKGIPEGIWKTFTDPTELEDALAHLTT